MSAPLRTLNDLDRDILSTLTQRVPMLGDFQARRIWWRDHESINPAIERLNHLGQLGWLDHYCLDLRLPMLRYNADFTWNPGDETPSMRKLRSAARKVETNGMVVSSNVYVASAFAANAYGIDHRNQIHADEFTELLAWGQVYVSKLLENSSISEGWNAENLFRFDSRKMHLPRHVSLALNGTTETLICLIAHSSQKSLVALHEQCTQQSRPYEMW